MLETNGKSMTISSNKKSFCKAALKIKVIYFLFILKMKNVANIHIILQSFVPCIHNPESCSITSSANSKLFMMVNLLVVIGSKIGIEDVSKLYKILLMAENFG